MRGTAVARCVTTTVAGLLVTGCALVVAAGAAVPGRHASYRFGQEISSRSVWYWPDWLWVVTAGLALAGLIMAVRPTTRRPAAAAAAVLSAQIAGRSIVGVRDWFNANGASTFTLAQNELATRVTIAAAMAMAGTVAACIALALLWREPARGWAAWRPRRAHLVAVGAAVAVLLPLRVVVMSNADAITRAGTVALTSSLPWGCALAAAAWLGPRARRATIGTVIACAAVTALSLATNVYGV